MQKGTNNYLHSIHFNEKQLLEKLSNSVLELAKKKKISFTKVLDLLKVEHQKKKQIPFSIFVSQLGCLEAIVKYLREELSLSYQEIALLLERKAGPIGVTYRKAKKKFPGKLDTSAEKFVPLDVLKSKLSVLEAIVKYLHEEEKLRFSEISVLLSRNQRTIWTVYARAKKKARGKNVR